MMDIIPENQDLIDYIQKTLGKNIKGSLVLTKCNVDASISDDFEDRFESFINGRIRNVWKIKADDQSRADWAILKAANEYGFNYLECQEIVTRHRTIHNANPEKVTNRKDYFEKHTYPKVIAASERQYSGLPDIGKKGGPLATLENMEEILKRLDLVVRYNVVSKSLEITGIPHEYTVDNELNCIITWVSSECAKYGFPTTKIYDFILNIADQNKFNPVVEMIESRPWDGKDRLSELNQSLGSIDKELSCFLLTRWMIGAVEAAYNEQGISDSAVLVLQGRQGIGKTTWLKALVGINEKLFKEGAILTPADKDSVAGVISYWIVELGEVDASFKRSDISTIKSFLTKNKDEFRRQYAAVSSTYPRRTVFCATVNEELFLRDETGNRRFFTIACSENINAKHDIDMQQVWAQIRHLHLMGETWKLTKEEHEKLNLSNETHQAADPIEELLLTKFDPNATIKNVYMSASEVVRKLGYEQPTTAQTRSCASALRKHFGRSRKTNGRAVYNLQFR